ncbi:hypothetical protein E2C01_037818 [Portunus trituberculatus]|uniref:Uncharacterized protein n=1 Tax=Portunus trituberculatus TaxID=210409 RepID=A0A5B7FI75_PORTR|nr:hypothetical protein [Portunus trituberculatus]
MRQNTQSVAVVVKAAMELTEGGRERANSLGHSDFEIENQYSIINPACILDESQNCYILITTTQHTGRSEMMV